MQVGRYILMVHRACSVLAVLSLRLSCCCGCVDQREGSARDEEREREKERESARERERARELGRSRRAGEQEGRRERERDRALPASGSLTQTSPPVQSAWPEKNFVAEWT